MKPPSLNMDSTTHTANVWAVAWACKHTESLHRFVSTCAAIALLSCMNCVWLFVLSCVVRSRYQNATDWWQLDALCYFGVAFGSAITPVVLLTVLRGVTLAYCDKQAPRATSDIGQSAPNAN